MSYFEDELKKRILAARGAGWSEDEIQSATQDFMRYKPREQGVIARNLPLIGAVAGGTIGSIIPGAGTIAGGSLGGAAGEWLRQQMGGEPTQAGRIATEGAYGLAGGVLGRIGGRLLGRGAQAGIEAGRRGALTRAGTALSQAVAKPKVAIGPFAAEKERAIVEGLKKLGLKGSAEAQRKQLPAVFRNLSSRINSALDKSKTKISQNEVTDHFVDAITKNINYDDTIPAYRNAANRFLTQLTNKKITSAKDLFSFKQNLGKQLSRAFDKIATQTPLTPAEDIGLSVWGSIDDLITRVVPKAKELTRLQSILYKAAPGLAKSAQARLKIPVVNVPIPGAAGAGQAIADKAGRLLMGAGEKLGALPPAIGGAMRNVVARTAEQATPRMLFGDQQPTELPQTTGAIPTDMMQTGGLQTPTQQPQITQPDAMRELFGQIMLQDLATTGGKNLSKLITYYDFMYPEGEQKVPAAQQKELSKVSTAENIYTQITAGLEELGAKGRIGGVLALGAGAVGAYPEVQAYNALRQASIGPLARAISGEVGVLTDRDIARAEKLLPKVTDTQREIELKLRNLRQAIDLRYQSASTMPQSTSELPDELTQLLSGY